MVGNIRSADRLIWTAIGNTPNLAARLQALTRQLNAAIVIDQATQPGAGAIATALVAHLGVVIRGRTQPETVYALPLPPSVSPGALAKAVG
jgi:class 3 adenylate cyclase